VLKDLPASRNRPASVKDTMTAGRKKSLNENIAAQKQKGGARELHRVFLANGPSKKERAVLGVNAGTQIDDHRTIKTPE